MNQYAERLRELEDALDEVTSNWFWHPSMLDIPQCRYCDAEGEPGMPGNVDPKTITHEPTCPRQVLVNDRIGYVRSR